MSLKLDRVKVRLKELDNRFDKLAYNKQKSSLVSSLSTFLRSNHNSGYYTDGGELDSATPEDVAKFLVDRDSKGRTQVHVLGCKHFGKSGPFDCGCERHLSAGTVDSYIGQLRAYFNTCGKTLPWRQNSQWGNPCISFRVQKYLKATRLEQAEARVTPRQAVPIFSDKIRWLANEIRKRITKLQQTDHVHFVGQFILYRDLAFFLCLWWAGDRSADLGRSKTSEVTMIDGRDLLLNHTIGKTVRQGGSSLVVIPKLDSSEMDPAGALEDMVRFARENGHDLEDGYLFRPSSPDHRSLINKPFTGNGPTNRLKLYFSASSDPGDRVLRPHGGRAGVAATLRLLGATDQEVMDHCGWATQRTYRHYTQMERVTRRRTTVLL